MSFYSSLNELGQKARGSLPDSILASHQAPHLWITTWQPRRRCVQLSLHQSSWFNAHLCTSVQYQFSCSAVSDSLRPREPQHTRLPCPWVWSPPKLMSIESVMPSNHLILCHTLLLLPSLFPIIRVFSNEPALCMRWPKYWSFSFSIQCTPKTDLL